MKMKKNSKWAEADSRRKAATICNLKETDLKHK